MSDGGYFKGLDFSATSRQRVVLLTLVGTLVCVAVAFTIDSYSLEEGRWRLGGNPRNNVIIPLVIAPPFFFYLLSKLRELAIAHQKLMVVATTDGLTSCLTRVAFATLVDAYLDKFLDQRYPRQGALLIIDVDHFKRVNDTFGHDKGDEVLQLIVEAIKSALREVDLVGRLGGEEFSVFLPGLNREGTEAVAERIRSAVSEADFIPDGVTRWDLSISIGGATFASATSFSELYQRADRRLYEAKRNGRNRVAITHGYVPGMQMARN